MDVKDDGMSMTIVWGHYCLTSNSVSAVGCTVVEGSLDVDPAKGVDTLSVESAQRLPDQNAIDGQNQSCRRYQYPCQFQCWHLYRCLPVRTSMTQLGGNGHPTLAVQEEQMSRAELLMLEVAILLLMQKRGSGAFSRFGPLSWAEHLWAGRLLCGSSPASLGYLRYYQQMARSTAVHQDQSDCYCPSDSIP